MVKKGDRIKLSYTSDCNPHNNKVGEVMFTNIYKYYPNANPNEFVWKEQCIVKYEDDTTVFISDTDRKDGRVISAIEIIN